MDNNLLLNEKKTKQMIITTRQMSKAHSLDGIIMPHIIKGKALDGVRNFKLLGTWISEDLKWTYEINQVVSSCYKILATLRRLKNMMPQDTKKIQVQSLILSKLNFRNSVTYPLPAFPEKKVQRVQNTAASFVLKHYCTERDVLRLGWLPTLENAQFNILKLTFKALHHDSWPECLRLLRRNPHRELRSSQAPLLQVSLIKGTFQDVAASLFNQLSPDIRKCQNFNGFKKECFVTLPTKAELRFV